MNLGSWIRLTWIVLTNASGLISRLSLLVCQYSAATVLVLNGIKRRVTLTATTRNFRCGNRAFAGRSCGAITGTRICRSGCFWYTSCRNLSPWITRGSGPRCWSRGRWSSIKPDCQSWKTRRWRNEPAGNWSSGWYDQDTRGCCYAFWTKPGFHQLKISQILHN